MAQFLGSYLSAYQGRIRGVGYGSYAPPWTSEIYWFQGVFRPRRVLSPPPRKDKKWGPHFGQIPEYAPTAYP